ncbi:MAG: glucosyl-3-phosphoglycerate synthase [Microthrixaceae bacterium]
MTEDRKPPAQIRQFDHRDFDVAKLLDHKAGTKVSVCLPARNEGLTVGAIVETLRTDLLLTGVVDEIVVIDDHSGDNTAAVAREAGALVVAAADILPEYGSGFGKGEVLWKSLYVAEGDLVIWCDADISQFGSRFVSGILGPLLCEPDVDLAKGYYRRPERDREGGGRVTELVARPLLSLFCPELAVLHQPLSGEYGGKRSVLEQLPFVQGYGVEVGLLIDLAKQFGLGGLVQVDLDVRHHRNRSLAELGPQAMAIAQTIMRHVDWELAPAASELIRPGLEPVSVDVSERPPMVEVTSYLTRAMQLTATQP